MIEKILLDYLDDHLAEDVYPETPEAAPEEYYRIEKTGSGESEQICRATIVIQSYADTLLRAAEMNQAVRSVMPGFVFVNNIGRVRLNSDYNYTDIRTKKYRYQAVYDIYYVED